MPAPRPFMVADTIEPTLIGSAGFDSILRGPVAGAAAPAAGAAAGKSPFPDPLDDPPPPTSASRALANRSISLALTSGSPPRPDLAALPAILRSVRTVTFR